MEEKRRGRGEVGENGRGWGREGKGKEKEGVEGEEKRGERGGERGGREIEEVGRRRVRRGDCYVHVSFMHHKLQMSKCQK